MNTVSRLYRRRIGEILVSQGVISSDQLEEALAIQKSTGELLGTVLLDLALVAESDIARVLCLQYQLPFLTLSNYEFDAKLLKLFPPEFLLANKLLPFDKIGETLLVIITEIPPENVLSDIPRLTKLNAALYVGYPSEVDARLNDLLAGERRAAVNRIGEAPKGARVPAPPTVERDGARIPTAVSAEADLPEFLGADEVDPLDAEAVDGSVELGTGGDDSEADPPRLVFESSSKSFLEELDSTWDSIFPGDGEED